MTTGILSVHKAALVLRILATYSPRGASLAEICESAGLPKATAHRILSSLVSERLVERPAGTRLYRLGPELFAFGISLTSIFDFRERASMSLKRISDETGQIALLGIRSGYDALCLDRHEGRDMPDNILIQLMDRWPLGVGVFSLAILAFTSGDEIDEILAFSERRIGNKAKFSATSVSQTLGNIRREGHVLLTFPKKPYLDLRTGIAVPIFDRNRRPIASLATITLAQWAQGGNRDKLIKVMMREAALISELHAKHTAPCLPDTDELEEDQETWKAAIEKRD
jgi:DNA-binding IclR family transcriptional regulator